MTLAELIRDTATLPPHTELVVLIEHDEGCATCDHLETEVRLHAVEHMRVGLREVVLEVNEHGRQA